MSRRTFAGRTSNTADLILRRVAKPSLELLELRRMLAADDLDSSFGTGGIVTDQLGTVDFVAGAVDSSTGNVAVVGDESNVGNAVVAQYDADGNFMWSFDLSPYFEDAIDVAIDASGGVIVAGTTNQDFIVARLIGGVGGNVLDIGFAGDGVFDDIIPGAQTATGVAVRPDGTVLVVGNDGSGDIAVLQLDQAGVPFGLGIANGFALVDVGSTADEAAGVALQSDGTAVIAGQTTVTTQDYAVVLLEPNGTMSQTVIDDGNSEVLSAVTVGPGDVIHAVGTSGTAPFLLTFDNVGTRTNTTPVGFDLVGGLDADSDGNVYAATRTVSFDTFQLTRFTPSGASDGAFGTAGTVTAALPGSFMPALDVAVNADDKPVAFGFSDGDVALVRWGDDGGGNTAPTVTAVTAPATAVRGHAASFSGSFTDPDVGDTHEVSWDFGDGNTIAFHPSTDSGALTPTHGYATTGTSNVTFNVTFTVRDNGLLVHSGSTTVTVSPSGIVSGNLLVGGAAGADTITVKDNVNGVFKVRFGNTIVGQYNQNAISKIVIRGENGADDITIEGDITLPSEIYGGEGDDVIKGGGGNDVIFGEGGNDKLKARNAHDILVGGAGSDTLAGGDGRDLLFGGTGADKIAGQDDSDIILSGTTSYDTASSSNLAALQAIHTEWRRTDLTTSQRINSIKVTGVGPGNAYKLLGGTTVFDDGARDTLTSGSGGDWFLANPGGTNVLDKITDLNSVDFLDSITFILAP
jgi:hypothetical protein